MAVRVWMLARVESGGRSGELLQMAPKPDRRATDAVAAAWLRRGRQRRARFRSTGEQVSLSELAAPSGRDAFLAVYPGVTLAVGADLGIDDPGEVPAHVLEPRTDAITLVHRVDSERGEFAYATYGRDALTRRLIVSAARGVEADVGVRRDIEEPFWRGDHPGPDDSKLRFVPSELAEAVRVDVVGFRMDRLGGSVDPSELTLFRYRR